jgi:hypothetical protein
MYLFANKIEIRERSMNNVDSKPECNFARLPASRVEVKP